MRNAAECVRFDESFNLDVDLERWNKTTLLVVLHRLAQTDEPSNDDLNRRPCSRTLYYLPISSIDGVETTKMATANKDGVAMLKNTR